MPVAVMSSDEVLDDAWQTNLLCHLQTFCNVADDNLCTLQVA